MSKKKEKSAPKSPSEQKEEREKKLLEEHPYETMSQIQNRYGNGRERNGSEGNEQNADRLNH